jgi:Domain of unknown function (DUF4114)/Lipase (class 3)
MSISPVQPIHALYELLAKTVPSYFGANRTTAISQLSALGYAVDRVFDDAATSFQAVGLVSIDKTKPPVLVFQGTVDDKDSVDDANPQGVGFNQFTANKEVVKTWLNDIIKDPTKNPQGLKVDFTGHSLGGALTQWFASEYPNLLGEAVSFQSPGIARVASNNFLSKGGKANQVTHYIVNGDIVSLGGEAFIAGRLRVADYQTVNNDPDKYFEKHTIGILNNIPGYTSIVDTLLATTLSQLNAPSFTYAGQDWQDFVNRIKAGDPTLGGLADSRAKSEIQRIATGSFNNLIAGVNRALAVGTSLALPATPIVPAIANVSDQLQLVTILNQGKNPGGAAPNPKNLIFQVNSPSAAGFSEAGFLKVDDSLGSIAGIKPGESGYLAVALDRFQVISSFIPNSLLPQGFDGKTTRSLSVNAGDILRFGLVTSGSIDQIRQSPVDFSKLVLADATSLAITEASNELSFNWPALLNLNLTARVDNAATPALGTNTQKGSQGELLDLRPAATNIVATFSIYREAAYNNNIYFYTIQDESGAVADTVNNKTLKPGDPGYLQAVLRNAVADVNLSTPNQTTTTAVATLNRGMLLAPVIVVNGTKNALLDSETTNDPAAYTPFLLGNQDKVDHIRLLGDNTFGFEDLAGGGDGDYNDVIVKVNLRPT